MKILIASGIMNPELGGPATYIVNIAPEIIKAGHQLVVLSYSDQDGYQADQNLAYQVFRIKRTNKISNYWHYYQKLKKLAKDCDVIYALDHFSAGLPAAWVANQLKKKLFIRVGGDFIWERYLEQNNNLLTLRQFYEQGQQNKKEFLRFKIIKYIFKKATGIIFTTEFQKNIFAKYYNLDLAKVFVIANAITMSSAASRNTIYPEIVFAGRFINKNNILKLIQAYQSIESDKPDLVLIGDGSLGSQIEQASRDDQKIRIEPSLSRSDLRLRLAHAYLVVFPSLTDISPNTLLECLGLGVPFVSSREIGFDWLKNKIKTFDPQNTAELSQILSNLLMPENYQKYCESLRLIKYEYDYRQSALDLIKILASQV